jgi:Flp pilus assembly CpaF family ATPase
MAKLTENLLKRLVIQELQSIKEGDEVDSALASFEQKNSIKVVQSIAMTFLKAIKKFEESTKDDHQSLAEHLSEELSGVKEKLLKLVQDDDTAAAYVKQEVTPRKVVKKVVFKPTNTL